MKEAADAGAVDARYRIRQWAMNVVPYLPIDREDRRQVIEELRRLDEQYLNDGAPPGRAVVELTSSKN